MCLSYISYQILEYSNVLRRQNIGVEEVDRVKVKDRTIQMKNGNQSYEQENCLIVEEYGIDEGKVYHRYITISEHIYEGFLQNPDDEKHLDAFLQNNGMHAAWKPYNVPTDEKDMKQLALFFEIDIVAIQKDSGDWIADVKKEMYQRMYNNLSVKDTLITNPLIMDVFNEAFREDPALGNWESVFPFFR